MPLQVDGVGSFALALPSRPPDAVAHDDADEEEDGGDGGDDDDGGCEAPTSDEWGMVPMDQTASAARPSASSKKSSSIAAAVRSSFAGVGGARPSFIGGGGGGGVRACSRLYVPIDCRASCNLPLTIRCRRPLLHRCSCLERSRVDVGVDVRTSLR